MPAQAPSGSDTRTSAVWWRPGTWRWEKLFEPVDAASLAVFRMAFGALMVWEVWRYWKYGWIKKYFIDPQFFFRYQGFEWLPAPSEQVAYGLWVLMAIGGAGVALGLFYRSSAALMTLTFVYFFLLDSTNYLNHFYLICLLGALMIVLPAHRIWSIDAWRRGSTDQTIPAWAVWLLRLQVGIPYLYGGIAKLERDWLLSIPMQQMLFMNLHLPGVGRYVTEWWVADLFAYGGMLFDLLIVPLLLWKRTRTFAFIWCLLFHLTNKLMLNIGVFPWMMIAATTIFFEPDWPRRLPGVPRVKSGAGGATPFRWTPRKRCVAGALVLWTLIQLLAPFRHYVYPNRTSWTEIGHRFAWRMKLRSKEALVGFYLVDLKSGDVTPVDVGPYLMPRQEMEMAQHPDMILQFSRFLGEQLEEIGYGDLEVRAEAWCSLNDRAPALLVDPAVDLSAQPRGGFNPDWILPLEEPPGPRQSRAQQVAAALRARAQVHSSAPP